MAKPVTEYEVIVKIRGGERLPTPRDIARIIRNDLYNNGYEVTVKAQVKAADSPLPENV